MDINKNKTATASMRRQFFQDSQTSFRKSPGKIALSSEEAELFFRKVFSQKTGQFR